MQETDGEMESGEGAALDEETSKRYERQVSAVYSSGRLWDDGIILPQNTRQVRRVEWISYLSRLEFQ